MKSCIIQNDIWGDSRVLDAALKAKRRVYCVAYVTRKMPALFKRGDILICDASEKAISFGETDPDVLSSLVRKGVTVYSHPGLHAKFAVFDGSVLVGSANMSMSSAETLVDLAVLTRDSRLAASLRAFVESLLDEANVEPLDLDGLTRLKSLFRRKGHPWQSSPGRRRKLRVRSGHVYKMESVHQIKQKDSVVLNEELEGSKKRANLVIEQLQMPMRGMFRNWYRTTNPRIIRDLKTGDSLILIDHCTDDGQKYPTVHGNGVIVKVEKLKKYYYVHYLVSKKGVRLSWFKSTPEVREAFPKGISNNCSRRIGPEMFASLNKAINRGCRQGK